MKTDANTQLASPEVLAELTDRELHKRSDMTHLFLRISHIERRDAVIGSAFSALYIGLSGFAAWHLHQVEVSETEQAQILLQQWQKPEMNVSVNFADSSIFKGVSEDCFAETTAEAPAYVLSEDGGTILASPSASLRSVQQEYHACVTQGLTNEAVYTPEAGHIVASFACALALAVTAVRVRNLFSASAGVRRLNEQTLALDTEIARRAEEKAAAPQPAAQ